MPAPIPQHQSEPKGEEREAWATAAASHIFGSAVQVHTIDMLWDVLRYPVGTTPRKKSCRGEAEGDTSGP